MSDKRYYEQQEKRPQQHQADQPGSEEEMLPQPIFIRDGYPASGRLEGKVALVTGGDSGIGRAVAMHFAREGADLALVYLDEHEDARETERLVKAEGRRCLLMAGDVGDEAFCGECVAQTVEQLGGLDILVNNAGEQHPRQRLEDISGERMRRTFRTNVFAYFYMARAAAEHLEKKGGTIINTTSITAYRGSHHLIDYSATKGAIVALTRSLAQSLAERGIRVNGVAPGAIWTPLIPATFPAAAVEQFGGDSLMGRAGQPAEVGPCYVFLACADASYMTGQILHPDGGEFTSS